MLAKDLLNLSNNVSPVIFKAVESYVVEDKVLGSFEYNPLGTVNGGNYVAIVNEYVSSLTAEEREFGTNYGKTEAKTEPKSYMLSPIGSAFNVDRAIARSLTENGLAVHNAQQLAQHTGAVKRGIATKFINGDTKIKGLKTLATELARIDATGIDLKQGSLREQAEAFLDFINDKIANSDVAFNRLYCSRKMAAKITTYRQLLNQATTPIVIGTQEFESFLSLPVVVIDGVDFSELTGESIYLVKMSTEDGVFIALPQDSLVLDVQVPVINGEVITAGYVEAVIQVIPLNKKAFLKVDNIQI